MKTKNDSGLDAGVTKEKDPLGYRLVGCTRFLVTLPVIGLFISSIAMAVVTLVQTVLVTFDVAIGELEMQDMLVDYVEAADFFLLAIVLYIMSIGLYSLFINDNIKMPKWLEIHTLDDLKEKLVGVIVVVMGVYFLGQLLNGTAAQDLLMMGIGTGAVICALAYFVGHVMVGRGRTDEGKEE